MDESTRKFVFERIFPLFLSEQSRSKFCANCPEGIVQGGKPFKGYTAVTSEIDNVQYDNKNFIIIYEISMLMYDRISLRHK